MSTETLTVSPTRADWDQLFNDDVFASLTGAYQTAARTGNRWRVVLSYMNLVDADRQAMWGHLLQLKGRQNRLRVNLTGSGGLAYVRAGAGGGTPLLVGAHSAGANSLSVDGATASVTNWLKAADFITIGNQLLGVAQSCNSNGSGQVTISIWPELHKNYADNTAVNISTPFGVFFLRDPGSLNMSRYRAGWRDEAFALSLEQDVLA